MRIEIDPNLRVHTNQTVVGFEDVEELPYLYQDVEVYESESGLYGPAKVMQIDHRRRLVYLAVEWDQLQVRK